MCAGHAVTRQGFGSKVGQVAPHPIIRARVLTTPVGRVAMLIQSLKTQQYFPQIWFHH